MANPFEILHGKNHDATEGKTPVSAESVNKINEAIDGFVWALVHQQFTVPRYVGDPDPDFVTVDGDGVDRSGNDLEHGYLKSIAGRDFFLVELPPPEPDINLLFQQFCKTNRRPTFPANDGDYGLNLRHIYGNGLLNIDDFSTIGYGQTINSGLIIEGVNFTDVGQTYSRLDLRGIYSTVATVSTSGGFGFVTIAGENFYDRYINPGDFVWLPNDATNRFYRVAEIVSATQIKLDSVPGTLATNQTCHVLRGPITFRNCRFECTVWLNNTYGITFHDCEFIYDETFSQYGGLWATPDKYPSDDPGAFVNLNVINCLFLLKNQNIAARPGPTTPSAPGPYMNQLNGGWAHNFFGNHFLKPIALTTGTGTFVANANGNTVRIGTGGTFVGNTYQNDSNTYNLTQARNFLAGVFYLYLSNNIRSGAAF